MNIIFATSNTGKVTSLKYHLKRHSVHVTVQQRPLDLIEPQADTAKEIARVKARQAWEQLHQPILVDDSSFHITALNGFPGPYIKPMLQTVGIGGILRLMEGYDDRSAAFISSLVYIDKDGIEHIFDDDPYTGTVALAASTKKKAGAWSDLHQIFIPTGCDKVLAELSRDQHTNVQPERVDSYTKFAEWMEDKASQ
ncbi:MAG TPA: non-canonical purine NTP pyrophosphatase [Candidatus Saccharibacteria bacterium]|nr:non-canonical purine NTP pyrophosphatase [Candidatus Saccharibacteria bacterium]